MSDHARVIRVLVLRPAAGKHADLLRVVQEAAERGRQIEGCFGVQVCDVREDPGDVCVISRWADASGPVGVIPPSRSPEELAESRSQLVNNCRPRARAGSVPRDAAAAGP